MKFKIAFLLGLVFLIWPAPSRSADTSSKSVAALCRAMPMSRASGFKDTVPADKLRPFVPEGYTVLDSLSSNFNYDGLPDALVILAQTNEDELRAQATDIASSPKRPFLLLMGDQNGSFTLALRNDDVVPCANCIVDSLAPRFVNGEISSALTPSGCYNSFFYITQTWSRKNKSDLAESTLTTVSRIQFQKYSQPEWFFKSLNVTEIDNTPGAVNSASNPKSILAVSAVSNQPLPLADFNWRTFESLIKNKSNKSPKPNTK